MMVYKDHYINIEGTGFQHGNTVPSFTVCSTNLGLFSHASSQIQQHGFL